MANPEHLKILKQGVEQWNKWRKEHPEMRPSLSGADLTDADLHGADLSGAKLIKADLNKANLSRASLIGARLEYVNFSTANLSRASLSGAILIQTNLSRANLSRADISGANLRRANLRRAILYAASLMRANFSGTDLRGANFTEAQANATNFADVDLSAAKGLETVWHTGPSTIGIDTVYKSRGKIPELFLRGCGVPDGFIAYIGSMVGRPIEFYSCFISYSTRDQEFAERLYNDLQGKDVRCWFAPHDVKGGRKLHEQIDEAIRLHDKLLLTLAEHSMTSEWVNAEIAKARKREVKEGKRVLFPVRLVGFEVLRDWECFDADTGKDSAREIREYFIPDFSNWKDHDSYQTAFQRLVKDLKAVDSG